MPEETATTDVETTEKTASEAGNLIFGLMGEGDEDTFDSETETEENQAGDKPDEGPTDVEEPEPSGDPEAEAEAVESGDGAEEADAEPEPEPTPEEGTDEGDPELREKRRLLEADYTRKTMAVADERKSLEAELASVRREREQYSHRLQLLEQAIAETVEQEPDWEALRAKDPAEYAATHADWQRRQAQRDTIRKAREDEWRKEAEDAQREQQQKLASETQRLTEAIPEWKDKDKAKEEATQLVEYARDLGYTDEQIGAVADHRVFLMLRKAMLYDALQTKGRAAVEKGKQKPKKPLQPGGKKTTDAKPRKPQAESDHARARTRLRESGRKADAAEIIKGLLPD